MSVHSARPIEENAAKRKNGVGTDLGKNTGKVLKKTNTSLIKRLDNSRYYAEKLYNK
jgi:hypothetical protein